jgi:hypothetical protein
MMRAFARDGDGSETDITEGVQALYDLVLSSMDWGSGFLSFEDALPVAQIGRLMGFGQSEEAERYVAEQKHSDEQDEFWRAHKETQGWGWGDIPHNHVYSSAGKCMWGGCNRKQGEADNYSAEQQAALARARDTAIERARQRAGLSPWKK